MTYARVIVTGSRHWTDTQAIWDKLDWAATNYWVDPRGGMIIVHGDAPGTDVIAGEWTRLPWKRAIEEPHPADWDKYGKAAGPRRNQEMVDLGAELCLAFPLGESRGTRDCMRRAEAAGIPVINYGDES